MIPDADPATGNLPPGIHEATWEEFSERFGTIPLRALLLSGLQAALNALRTAGCRRVYIDGSFVTNKDMPGDFDGCWEASGVNIKLLDPVLLDFRPPRIAQKIKYGGELFVAQASADPWGTRFLEFFQRDHDGNAKGIVALNLEDVP